MRSYTKDAARERTRHPGHFGNYGYYNPPYQRETSFNSPMGNPFSTPYGGYKRFPDRDYSRYRSRGPHAGRGPRGYQRSDERLTDHSEIDPTEIEVRVENGEVGRTIGLCRLPAYRWADDKRRSSAPHLMTLP